jgi:anti-anti-sigma factor
MLERQLHHLSCPILVLRLTGPNIQGDIMADELRDEMLGIYLAAHGLHIVLDFQSVKFLSSAGFRPLLRLNRQVREHGGRLVLCNLSAEVTEIFAVTRLISTSRAMPATFEVQPDVPTAIGILCMSAPEPAAEADKGSS